MPKYTLNLSTIRYIERVTLLLHVRTRNQVGPFEKEKKSQKTIMSGYMNPKNPKYPRRPRPAGAPWGKPVTAAVVGVSITVWVLVALAIALAGIAGVILGAIAIARDDHHHDRTHAHIKRVGFSTYKNDTQILNSTAVIVNTWTAQDGWPAYDATKGGLNGTSGVWTVTKSAYYMATGSVCFTPSANGTREARLVTSGATSAIVYARQDGSATLTGDQCVSVSQILRLPGAATVWLEAFSNSGNLEEITGESRFSVERIAINH